MKSLRWSAPSIALLAMALVCNPGASSAAEDPADEAVTSVARAPLSRSADAGEYWTTERMLAATPVSVGVISESSSGDASSRGLPTSTGPGQDGSNPVLPQPVGLERAVPVPATTGKLFYNWAGGDYVCSASTVNSVNKNVVMTAAHCVYEARKGWHSKMAFVPAFFNGSAPYGVWGWATARTFTTYQTDGAQSHDQAFLTVAPLNGRNIVDAVGGNGLSWGYATAQSGVRVWGYPAEGKYDGRLPYYCDGNTTDHSIFNDDAQIVCDMTGGSSGGPWLRERIDVNLGYVFAVTSRRTLSGTPMLIATPNAERVYTMFLEM